MEYMLICLILLMQLIPRAISLAFPNAGRSIADRIAMIEITMITTS